MTQQERIKIINGYVVAGVPASSLKNLCREAKISYPKLIKELRGQTMGVVNDEAIVYPCDIINFIEGRPVLD